MKRKATIDKSLRMNFDEAINVVKLIEGSANKPADEILDILRTRHPI